MTLGPPPQRPRPQQPGGCSATRRRVAERPRPESGEAQRKSGEQLPVESFGYAPVKGTRHITRPEAVVDAHGPVDDRRYCLIDVEQRQVLKTVQNPALIGILASLHGDGGDDGHELELRLPDGRSVSAVPEPTGETLTCDYWKRKVELRLTEGPHAALASDWLGRPVRLVRAPRGDIVFGSPISIVTTASMRDLAARIDHPDLLAEAARFRATVVVNTDEPYVEETWQGEEKVLTGSWLAGPGTGTQARGLRVRIGAPIPRCAVMDLHPVTGERGPRLLRTLAGYRPTNEAREPLFGVNAEVVAATPPELR